jgi:alkaline phosphatase
MKYLFSLLLPFCLVSGLRAQTVYTAAQVHSHNDYEQPVPFHTAYQLQAGSIEADVYLKEGELYVAHNPEDIRKDRTLEALYLKPLQGMVQKNGGSAYARKEATLQLMIDLKTEGRPTLLQLVKKLSKYPEITANPTVQVVISGNVPAPATWTDYPAYIRFDGRPGQAYTAPQLERVAMISIDFGRYSKWNGKGKIVKTEQERLSSLIDSVHRLNKKLRFWATSDQPNAWKALMGLGVDYIGTDDIPGLVNFLKKLPDNEYRSTAAHRVYTPQYVRNDQRSKVKNVILLIGDGMGLAQIYAGYTAAAGQLNLFNFLNIGFSKTSSADSYITDSAAGATAMATGQKTQNRVIGLDAQGKKATPLPDLLATNGMSSGLISSGDITDATPACFYAHQPERSMSEAIAADFLNSPVSILIGGNYAAFGQRKDGQSLIPALQRKGYVTADRFAALDTITASRYVVLDNDAVVPKGKGRGDFLCQSFRKVTTTLSKNKQGFFLMAEGAQIDHGGHANQLAFVVKEMLDFDLLVGEAMQFADRDGETLVIVTADHETGGLSLLDGDIRKGYVAGNFSSPDHSGVTVPVFAYGPHSLDFRGVYENTEIFEKIRRILSQYQTAQR